MYKLEIIFNPEVTATCPIKVYSRATINEEWKLEEVAYSKGKVSAVSDGNRIITRLMKESK